MKETREVKELRSKILGVEMELYVISKDLERFKDELLYNTLILEKIKENITFLKSNRKLTISFSEFKKIKQQKKLVETRMVYYKQKIEPLEKSLFNKETFHKTEMEKFEEAYRTQFRNNILEFPDVRRKEA
jgi:hypothetical protein